MKALIRIVAAVLSLACITFLAWTWRDGKAGLAGDTLK